MSPEKYHHCRSAWAFSIRPPPVTLEAFVAREVCDDLPFLAEREQRRVAFEVLDADPGVRVIVVRAIGERFSSGGEIGGFLEASPEHVSPLAWNIACDFRLASETCLYALPEERRAQIRGSGSAEQPTEDGRHQPR